MSDNNRGGLGDSPFSYRESGEGKVFIFWRGSRVKILKGSEAESFLRRLLRSDPAEQQRVMAKVTGNFKRGNER